MHCKIGTDICSVNRIERAYQRFGDKLLKRILTQNEINYVLSCSKHFAQSLAGRFAAKEAVSKLLGCGWRGIGWHDVEIINRPSGEPALAIYGRAAQLSRSLALAHFEVTLSHEREYATAVVLGYSE